MWIRATFRFVEAGRAPTGGSRETLFVPMRHTDGHPARHPLRRRADEPAPPDRRWTSTMLVALRRSRGARRAVRAGSGEAARHRLALGSCSKSRLTGGRSSGGFKILRAVCAGVRDALGFRT
jgi:hypothetical protein